MGGGLSDLTIILIEREAMLAMYLTSIGFGKVSGKFKDIVRPVASQYIYLDKVQSHLP
jgi:hypothetical protein